MSEKKQRQNDVFSLLPAPWAEDLLPQIRARVQESGRKVIVLDDDPTGTQTVHGVPVLTEWGVERLAAELRDPAPAAYLLTNSRSLPLAQAQALNQEIGRALRQAGEQAGRDFAVISRSDSTLRGHFPGEVQALAAALGTTFDAWLVIPFFIEGGRYTIDDVHYVAEGEWLAPAGETEFARDKSFGYRASNLREWVVEKVAGTASAGTASTGAAGSGAAGIGALSADQVASISLADLRQGGPGVVTQKLLGLPRGAVCVVNAADYRDLEVFVLGLLEAEAQGRRYLYRTAASFVRVRAGIEPRPLLTAGDLALPESGAGLVIAGSYVPRTSAQLEALFAGTEITPVEVSVAGLLDSSTRQGEVHRAVERINELLAQGQDAAVFTSRQLVSTEGAEQNLSIGRVVSNSLVEIVRGLRIRPRYLLAKGGITSSDVATLGLGIRRALVLGQVLPGVPVWRCGPESAFPGLTYVVFPGNVGSPDALAQIVRQFAMA